MSRVPPPHSPANKTPEVCEKKACLSNIHGPGNAIFSLGKAVPEKGGGEGEGEHTHGEREKGCETEEEVAGSVVQFIHFADAGVAISGPERFLTN
jgi:hypothetical protein